ncbi:sulfotransferase [Colwellia sp. 20A7]|uniref:sulfotransferase n=1 Tax=Colwellia sp. 20A7 TaxID=2689569 RepID=UPI00135CAF24|nr:sulfotransferase [Colwellia sp. 20A7]
MNIESGVKQYNKDLKSFENGRYKYPLRSFFQKKAFHAFCIGTPKSGTHSIANILKGYRATHEPNEIFMINLINKKAKGEISHNEIIKILKSRDISNWLEMESSHYLGGVIEQLIHISDDAKYILTIRDCLSWMDSWFNHQLSRPTLTNESVYDLGRNNYYSRGHQYTKHDRILEEMKLYPVRSYLEFWKEHNQKVINSVHQDKLLIIKTQDISKSTSKILSFLDVDTPKIINNSTHEFKAKGKHGILEKLDTNFIYDIAMEICGELNDTYFPEKSIATILKK